MNFNIKELGECTYKASDVMSSPMPNTFYVPDSRRLLFDGFLDMENIQPISSETATFELAGPRKDLFFKPSEIRCAIVTCGGLCPGLNDVIRAIVMTAFHRYGVKSIYGIKYGYLGLNPANGYPPIELTPNVVTQIHLHGGTILGSSRGGTNDVQMLVNTLQYFKIDILFAIGGDGTLKGAHNIYKEASKRGMKLSVIGIPKTIDNDINFIQRSFGFETAYSKAVDSIYSAHVEAKGAPNGIGLVKLMGRDSGFIAANATLAVNDVNFVLIPEVKFDLDGANGFLTHLEKRMQRRGHAVICVAEGAGQEFMMDENGEPQRDASGNVILNDIGIFLKNKINEYFKSRKIQINLKYIDPSYMIRSAVAVPTDAVYCGLLGQYAVHAGMAGKTDCAIGQYSNSFIHIPIEMAISKRKHINPESLFWYSVLESTGQPESMKN
ncbi:MAG: ATP-dependent 6-phosphofructokinase [Spirochaetes bacterium]|nr:ATP-dependent 6-phosphofructokinase [Spirochaetota bacterium]